VSPSLELTVVPSSVSVFSSKLSNFATTMTAGIRSSFVMNVKDEYGNPMQVLPVFEPRFSVFIVDSFQKSAPYAFRAVESTFGAYVIIWTVTVAGSFTLNIEIDGNVCPFASESFVVMPGPLNPSSSSLDFSSLRSVQAGISVASALSIRDLYGNRLQFGSLGISSDYILNLVHTSQPLERSYRLNVSSVTTSLFVVTTTIAGRYTISLELSGQSVPMPSAAFVLAGPADIFSVIDTNHLVEYLSTRTRWFSYYGRIHLVTMLHQLLLNLRPTSNFQSGSSVCHRMVLSLQFRSRHFKYVTRWETLRAP